MNVETPERLCDRVEEIVHVALECHLGFFERRALLKGLPPLLSQSLPALGRPADQLRSDIEELARHDRDTNEAWLEKWVRNAIFHVNDQSSRALLEALLGETSSGPDSWPSAERPLRVLLDNWLLQSAGEFLSAGPDYTIGRTLHVDGSYSDHPQAGEGVLSTAMLLTSLVLHDEIMVDEEWMKAWRGTPQIEDLKRRGIVVGQPKPQTVTALTQRFVEKVTTTDALRQIQRENQAAWADKGDRRLPHHLASSIMWGSAGYLGRAFATDLPYIGHPSRMSLLRRTVFAIGKQRPTASAILAKWVTSRRSELLGTVDTHEESSLANLALPGILSMILGEASGPDDVISVALEVRSHFEPLRRWLSAYQSALWEGDPWRQSLHQSNLDDAWERARISLSRSVATPLAYSVESVAAETAGPTARSILYGLLFQPFVLGKLLDTFSFRRDALRFDVEEYLAREGAMGTS